LNGVVTILKMMMQVHRVPIGIEQAGMIDDGRGFQLVPGSPSLERRPMVGFGICP